MKKNAIVPIVLILIILFIIIFVGTNDQSDIETKKTNIIANNQKISKKNIEKLTLTDKVTKLGAYKNNSKIKNVLISNNEIGNFLKQMSNKDLPPIEKQKLIDVIRANEPSFWGKHKELYNLIATEQNKYIRNDLIAEFFSLYARPYNGELPNPTPEERAEISNLVKKLIENPLTRDRSLARANILLKNAIQELESDEFQKDLLIDIGFDKEGSEKILTEDPKNPLSATNLPKDIQESIQNMLKNRKKNGYDETSDKNTHEITGVMNYIVSTSKSIPNIRFSLSNIPTIVNANYNYIGYTFSGVFDTQAVEGTYGSVRRVYNSLDSSHILIIEESANNKHAGAYLIKDFVNTVVNEYPAIYSIKKSPNGKYFALLNWIIPSYTYDLYFVGALNNNTKNILLSIGNEISKINIKNEGNSETNINSNNPSL